MKIRPAWSSYIPLMVKIMQESSGDVLELGMGITSTPILHWLCFDQGRGLVSFEGEKEFINLNRHFRSSFHKMYHVKNWDTIDIEKPWGVVLVDHNKERRAKELARVSEFAEYVLVHDTQPKAIKIYKLRKAFRMFKYRFDYAKREPYTSVLSNFHDLSFLEDGMS